MELSAEEWGRKGATLSDKTARSEYGLTQDEILASIHRRNWADSGRVNVKGAL
jgi:hypothetical protein